MKESRHMYSYSGIHVKFITAFLAFILLIANIAKAETIPSEALQPCENKDCYVVAEKIPLKETSEIQGVKYRSNNFVVTLPPNVIGIDQLETITVYYRKNSPHIIISTETDKDFRLNDFTSKLLSVLDFLDIIFTKTPKDREIFGAYDKVSWNNFMWFKKLTMENNNAFVCEKGKLKTYYISGLEREPYKNIAWVVNSEYPDVAFRLESNIGKADFINILSSITSFKPEGK